MSEQTKTQQTQGATEAAAEALKLFKNERSEYLTTKGSTTRGDSRVSYDHREYPLSLHHVFPHRWPWKPRFRIRKNTTQYRI